MKYVITYLVLFATILSHAQDNNFEVSFLWDSDTSAFAVSLIELENSEFILLTNVEAFSGGNGVPIEGEEVYGSGLVFVNNYGEITDKRLFYTNTIVGWDGLNTKGRIPSEVIHVQDEKIILPYSVFVGLNLCDSTGNVAANSYKSALLNINKNDLSVLNDTIYNDSLCSEDEIIGFINEAKIIKIIVFDKSLNSTYILTIDQALGIQNKEFLPFNINAWFQPLNDEIILLGYDGKKDSSIILRLDINSYDIIFSYESSSLICKNQNNIVLVSIDESNYPVYNSKISLFDSMGVLIAERIFQNTLIKDVKIDSTGNVITLEDKVDSDKRVRITYIQDSLQNVKIYEFGDADTWPIKLNLHTNGKFSVIGGKYFYPSQANEPRRPNEIYFLFHSLDSLKNDIDKKPDNFSILTFPNPASEFLFIDAPKILSEDIYFKLLDLSGREVLSNCLVKKQSTNSLKGTKPGSYLLIISKGNQVVARKKIIITD